MTSLIESGLANKDSSIFDFGCGRGDDLKLLKAMDYNAVGWDPVFSPDTEKMASDVVNLGFVLNVIERPAERVEVIREAYSLATDVLVVSVRLIHELPKEGLQPFKDG